ncbi:MAG: LysR family transcriptional regulator [Acidimicrobiia bacterium]|nr:LysR family transcriptional regulator [Actinomycetota bacterium]MBL6924444.1 LysR family transcriptional regulator [Acidimicrobiia bacterium]MBL6926602.1 LysR family transcriptional regulator [Acidimicrobiia bacterium]
MSPDNSLTRAVSLPNLTVQQLEYMVAAADNPTRAAAAASLGVTPSALTQGLAELERRVGLPLFERSGRHTRLRPQADEVLAHARRVVAETRDLARWSMAQRSGSSGLVRLGTIDAVAVQHRAEAIRSFHRNQPEVDLRLTVAPSGILIDGLVAGDLDLIVCVQPANTPDGVSFRHCFDEPLHVYAPEGESRRPPAEWGPWVTFPAGSNTRAVISTGLAAVGAPFEVVAESNQPEVLREMVRLGLGWTVLPPVGSAVRTGAMAPARSEPVAQRRLVVGRRVGAPPDPAADALASALTRPDSGR